MRRAVLAAAAAILLGACGSTGIFSPDNIAPPTGLTYQLIPSGDPANPEGIRLRWDPTTDPNVTDYVVYSRAATTGAWSRRGETTSASFDDLGVPDLQYYVTAQVGNGSESAPSATVTVDATNQLSAPTGLAAIALDTAAQFSWSASARLANPAEFSYYRVYSTLYDLDTNVCDSSWVLEGTTVSESFISTGLPNGVPRCFTVSAISQDGHESDWAVPVTATPRYDARNVLIYPSQDQPGASGFAFFVAASQQLGAVLSSTDPAIDFRVDRHADGSLWMVPVRAGTSVALYSASPIADLTSIGLAPDTGYSTGAIEAVPGYGYVFEMTQADGLHFGGLRVTAVTSSYMIFDWSYQTDPGNPELRRVGPGGAVLAAAP